MPKVFRLVNSTNLKQIGIYPQVETGVYPINVNDEKYSSRLWFKKDENLDYVFPEPIIHSRAKLTDYISCSIMGTEFKPLISTKLKNIIEDSIHKEIQFIPAVIHYKGDKKYDYWFMNYFSFSPELIDFERSDIWIKGDGKKKTETRKVVFTTVEEYLAIEKDIKYPLSIDTKHLEIKYDQVFESIFFLRWPNVGKGIFINEQLKKEIEKADCTGLDFLGINERV